VSVKSGSATAETLSIQKAGAVFTLIGTPTVSKTVIGQTASSTFVTSFTFNVAANGSDLTVASTSAFVIGVYINGSRVATTTASYEKPTSGITQTGSGPYGISDGAVAQFEAKTSFIGPNGVYVPAGGIVTTRLESITTSAGTETYVSDTFRASKDGQGNSITL
jgi:hypothetical protein